MSKADTPVVRREAEPRQGTSGFWAKLKQTFGLLSCVAPGDGRRFTNPD
jgi:hypothetical protein